MSVRTQIKPLACIKTGSEVLDYLLSPDGLNYSSFVDVPDGTRRNRGQNGWYETHLVDKNGDEIIRYIELEASADSSAFSDLKKNLKRHGSPINELFTVVSRLKLDKDLLTSPLDGDPTPLRIEDLMNEY